MRKFAALCSALILVLSAAIRFGPEAAAADPVPTLLWDFNEDERMSADMGANSLNAVRYRGEKDAEGNDCYVFTAESNDPYVSIDLSAADFSGIVWVKARVKNSGPATAVELFGHTGGRGLIGSECTHIDVAGDGEWHTYVVFIPDENVRTVNAYKDPQYAVSSCYWEGTVDWIRLDPMWQEGDDGSDSGGSMRPGDEIRIDYVAFFPTEEEAKAFRAWQDDGSAAGKPDGSGDGSAEEAPAGGGPAGFGSAKEAAGGRDVVTDFVFLSGTEGFGGRGPENLFDGDTATEFRTDAFPAEAVVRLNGVYNIVGFAMAAGEDPENCPDAWTVSVSSDGENWVGLTSGAGDFFGRDARTYYAGDAYAYGVSYVKFSADAAASGTFGLSELALFGEMLAPAAGEEPESGSGTGTGVPRAVVIAVTALASAAAGFAAGFAIGRRKR